MTQVDSQIQIGVGLLQVLSIAFPVWFAGAAYVVREFILSEAHQESEEPRNINLWGLAAIGVYSTAVLLHTALSAIVIYIGTGLEMQLRIALFAIVLLVFILELFVIVPVSFLGWGFVTFIGWILLYGHSRLPKLARTTIPSDELRQFQIAREEFDRLMLTEENISSSDSKDEDVTASHQINEQSGWIHQAVLKPVKSFFRIFRKVIVWPMQLLVVVAVLALFFLSPALITYETYLVASHLGLIRALLELLPAI